VVDRTTLLRHLALAAAILLAAAGLWQFGGGLWIHGKAWVAQELIARAWADAQAARCLGYRGFAKLVRGGNAPEQALMKLMSSEARQRAMLTAAELEGARGLDASPQVGPFTEWTALEHYFVTFGGTISAGSSEIQRNIIAEKVLGLPRG